MNLEYSADLREFNRLHREMGDIYHCAAVQYGLSDTVASILYTLGEFGSCTQREISKYCLISPQTINSAVKKLQQEGILVLGDRSNRQKQISLTPAGEALMEKVVRPIVEAENQAFAVMELQERQELLRLSRKYMELLRKQLENTVKG